MAAAAVVSQPTQYRSTSGVPLPSALQGGLTDVLLAPAVERHTQMEHIKQLKEFGLGFEPRRADTKDAFSFDPERHKTRMNWLYGRLAEEGEKHTYTVAAKEWILNRQTRVDMAARRGRKNTTWWEYPDPAIAAAAAAASAAAAPATPGTPAAKKLAAAATASPRPSGVPAKLDPVLSLGNKPKQVASPTPAKVEPKKVKEKVPAKAIVEDAPPPPPDDEPPPPPPDEEDDLLAAPGALDVLSHLAAADSHAVPRLTGPVTFEQTLSNIAIRSAFRIFLETGTENPNAFSAQVESLKASLDDFDHSANLRNLDFFEDIERWKDRFYPHESRVRSSSVAVAPSGGRPGFDMKSLLAKKLYSKFLRDDDEDVPGGGGGGDDKRLALTLSPAQRNRIQARLNLPLTMYPEAPPIGAMDDDDDDSKGTPRQSVKAMPVVAVSTPSVASPQSLQDAVNQLLSASDFAALATHVGATTTTPVDAKDSPKPSVIFESKNLVILSKDEDKRLRLGGASEEVWDEVIELVRYELAKMLPLFNLSPAIEKMRKADEDKAAEAKAVEERKKEREKQRVDYEIAMKLRKEKEEAAAKVAEAKRIQMAKAKLDMLDEDEDDDNDDDDDNIGPDDTSSIPNAPEGPVTDFSDIGSPQAVRRRRKAKYEVVPAGPTNMSGVLGHPKPPPWKNEKGYQSVVLDIIELRGGAACGGPGGSAPSQEKEGSQGETGNSTDDCKPNKGQTKWYCHVSVDSTTYRSKETWGLFNDKMEFILSDTTQYVQIELYRSKEETQMVGYVLVPIHEIVTETQQTQQEAAAVDTVLRNASASVGLVTPSGGVAASGGGGMGSTGVAAAAGTILTPPTLDKDGKPLEAKDDLVLEPQWYKIELPPNTPISDKTSSVLTMELFFNVNLLKREAKEDTEHKAIIVAEEKSALADAIRGKVSKKKKRWQQDGFDLDLTYVTPQIIAMGFPSEGSEGMFRNHMRDVQRFFTRRHPTAYKIYNLCSERAYDPEKFEGSAVRYPFDDHNPCPMNIMHGFCEDMRQWIQAHPQNVTSVHCKAGKGRTGTVIAAYLIYCGQEKTADEALEFFGRARTKNNKGVTIPSQMRYVHYFESYIKMKKRRQPQPGPCTLFLHAVVLHKIPKGVGAGAEVSFVIKQTVGDKKWKSGEKMPAILDKESGTITFDVQSKIVSLNEDCKFEFYHSTTLGTKKMFHFWFNTRYQKLEWAPTREGHARGGDSGSDVEDGEEEEEDDDEPDSDDEAAPPGTPSSAAKKPGAKVEEKKEVKKPATVATPASPAKAVAIPAKTATPAVAVKVPSSPAASAKAAPATPVAGATAVPAKSAPSTLALPAAAAVSPGTPRSSANLAAGAPVLTEKEQKKAEKAKKKGKDLSPAEKYSAIPPPWPEMIVYPNHPRIRLHKGHLDKAVKDKKHKKYHKDFQVEVIVTRTSMSTVVKAREVIEAEGSLPAAVAEARAASSSLKIVTSTPVSTTRPLQSQSVSSPATSAQAGTPAKATSAATPVAAVAAKR